MKFVHISDTHIRNLKYHEEYLAIFQKIYEKIKELSPDYIIHTGDLAHSKTQLSPEYFSIATQFLDELSNITQTYIILGNHDLNLRSLDRQNAIKPIVEALKKTSLILLEKYQVVELRDNFCLHNLCITDKPNWKLECLKDKINIALFHGSILGCETESGWSMEHAEEEISTFKVFDYALLGDIHKTNQKLDIEGRIRYAGSTIQQSFGETNDKGFLLWEIENKEKFKVEHYCFENPCPFVTIKLINGMLPEEIDRKENSRVKIVSDIQKTNDEIRKIKEEIRIKFNPKDLLYSCKTSTNNKVLFTNKMVENIYDFPVQEKLIKRFFELEKIEEDKIKKIIDLNKRYAIEKEDGRCKRWSLKKLKWNNLFSYGKNNEINFDSLRGTVGIFGKNFVGKSSVIDSLLMAMFNNTSKLSTKNVNIINENCNEADVEVEIEADDKRYVIKRMLEKYKKTTKGFSTTEAKTAVELMELEQSGNLNQETRVETDKMIRMLFGTLEDFSISSLCYQFGLLSFINEGSTRRKEILSRFLGTNLFEQKYVKSKEDSMELRNNLKFLEQGNIEKDISICEDELRKNIVEEEEQLQKCAGIKEEKKLLQQKLEKINLVYKEFSLDILNLEELLEKLRKTEIDKKKNEEGLLKVITDISEKQKLFIKIEELLKTLPDVVESKNKLLFLENKEKEIEKILGVKKDTSEKLKLNRRESEILQKVPCGDQYPKCMFIQKALESRDKIKSLEELLETSESQEKQNREELGQDSSKKVKEFIEKYQTILNQKTEIEKELFSNQLKEKQHNILLTSLDQEIRELKIKIELLKENEEVLKSTKDVVQQREECLKSLKRCEDSLEQCEQKVMKCVKEIGSCEKQIEQLKIKQNQRNELREKCEIYELFLRSCHPSDGISYQIIRDNIEILNQEIANILENVVDFEILLDASENRLNIFIRHPKFSLRPIELASGAEKALASIAIRMALIRVSTLPVSNIFILDEAFDSFDEEHLAASVNILEILKTQFDIVLIISHNDFLKDSVDRQIIIEKDEFGFAHIRI